ncbi:MAG: hypothetical protein MJZ34_08985 [Paludibacteraceae bacterium]|nr:hypothetical protein [Paludibacteraceae bacterium]
MAVFYTSLLFLGLFIGFYQKCGFHEEIIVLEFSDGTSVRYNINGATEGERVEGLVYLRFNSKMVQLLLTGAYH